jgi:hypothetical protein
MRLLTIDLPLEVDVNARTIKHWITKPTVDYDQDVVLPNGADLERFQKNPTVSRDHIPSTDGQVGRCLELDVRPDGIVAVTRLADRPQTLPDAVEWYPDTLLHLYSTGDLRGVSIYFTPQEVRPPSPDESIKWPNAKQIVAKWEMLDYSFVRLPNCKDALTYPKGVSKRLCEYIAKGKKITPITLKSYFPRATIMQPIETRIEIAIQKAVQEKRKKLLGERF